MVMYLLFVMLIWIWRLALYVILLGKNIIYTQHFFYLNCVTIWFVEHRKRHYYNSIFFYDIIYLTVITFSIVWSHHYRIHEKKGAPHDDHIGKRPQTSYSYKNHIWISWQIYLPLVKSHVLYVIAKGNIVSLIKHKKCYLSCLCLFVFWRKKLSHLLVLIKTSTYNLLVDK